MMGMTQLKHSTTRVMVHLGRETLAVTKTGEALPIEEILGEDIMEVIEVTTGEDRTTDTKVDTMVVMAKDRIISVHEATEAEITIEVGNLGMETEIKTKMKGEIIVTIMTTENNVRTGNQTDKFCPGLQSFWTNLSQKTCRGGAYPCNWPPPQWSIAGKRISSQSKAL